MGHDKPLEPPRKYMTVEDKAAAERLKLFMTHMRRGSLGTYYQIFPDEMPLRLPASARDRDDEGRER